MNKTLFKNSKIVTANSQREIIEHGYILVEGQTILEIGRGDCPCEAEVDAVTDTNGSIIMPGLVNAHSHSYSNIVKGTTENLPLELWMLYVMAEGKALTKEDVHISSLLGSIEMLKGGTTCFLDHLAQPIDSLTEAAKAYERIGTRVCLTPMFSDKPYSKTLPKTIEDATQFCDTTPVDLQQHIELLKTTYEVLEGFDARISFGIGPSAPHRCSDDLLLASYELAVKYDVPWHTHILETRIQKETAKEFYQERSIEHLDSLNILSPRCSLAHVVWVSERELQLLAEKQATVVHNPTSNLFLGSGIAPLLQMKEAGVNVALGTDGANCNGAQSMFESMKLAAILSNLGVADFMRWVHATDVLEMATTSSAAALGLEHRIGSLDVGKEADFIIINPKVSSLVPLNDLVWQLVYGRTDLAVTDVYVAGNKVVENGRLLTVDEEDLFNEALQRGRSLLRRMERKYGSIRNQHSNIREAMLAVLKRPSE